MPDPSTWSALTFPSLAYGQGLAVTALQITEVYATMANSGVSVQPKLIDAYVRPDGTVQPTAASPSHRVIGAETAHQVVEMMESVVSDGTAPVRDPRVPGRRQDRHGRAGRPDLRLLPGLHRLVHRDRARRRPAGRRRGLDRQPAGGPLRRRARRPGVHAR